MNKIWILGRTVLLVALITMAIAIHNIQLIPLVCGVASAAAAIWLYAVAKKIQEAETKRMPQLTTTLYLNIIKYVLWFIAIALIIIIIAMLL